MAHRHIIGSQGTGKTTLLSHWLIEDIKAGNGVCYFDLSGTATDTLLQFIPPKRIPETYLFDPSRFAVPWNPLLTDNPPFTATAIAEAIKTANGYGRVSTPQMDAVLFNGLLALIEAKQSLFGMYLMLVCPPYRTKVMSKVKNAVVKGYWTAFETLKDYEKLSYTASVFNKVEPLMADSRLRAIFGTANKLPLKDIAQGGLLFVSLPQGEFGMDRSSLIASIMLTCLQAELVNRTSTVPFSVYIEDVHRFAPEAVISMLGTMARYGVQLTVTNRYTAELDPALFSALSANAESYVFRLSPADAEAFPTLPPQALTPQQLEPYQYWRFGLGKPVLEFAKPLTEEPYEASLRTILSHHKRNLHAPQTAELDALVAKFS